MSVCGSSGLGQKVRLNVASVIDGQATLEKFVVCIDGEASMKDLRTKVASGLRKNQIDGHLLHLMNAQRARLPDEEPVGDMLRDGEEVVAALTRELEHLATARSLENGVAAPACAAPAPPPPPAPEPEEEVKEAGAPEEAVPGPCELPVSNDFTLGGKELRLSKTSGDWELDGLTPKLREYISMRFSEASCAADPSTTFISVSMQPQGTEPIHYSIARIDVIEFERLCTSKIQEVQARLDYFRRCRQALGAIVEKGATPDDYAPNMLPYRYKADEEFCSLLSEADSHSFGQAEGFRPLVLVDPSGTVAETWLFVRTALKRMLYSFMVTKKKFNLMKFAHHGRAAVWESCMVPPSAQKLRDAEDWLDSVRPMRNSPDFAGGLRAALASQEADVVYLLTGGLPGRCDADYILGDIRAGNVRGLPIHVIGIDCDARAELDLRRLAEDNRGSFRQKRFATGGAIIGAGIPAGLSEPRPTQLQTGTRPADESMTIGGQVDILEIMSRESEGQLSSWLDEQKCAHRLLLVTATQQPVPLPDSKPSAPSAAGRRGPPRLQELLEAAHGAAHHAGAVAGGLVSACRPPSARGCTLRRDLTQVPQPPPQGPRLRAQTHTRSSSAAAGCRRPSLVNPWDAPSGPIRISQLSARGSSQRSASLRRSLRPAAAH